MVAVGRHYGAKVESGVPYDPQSKGGSEATVKIAKRNLVPPSKPGGRLSVVPRACRGLRGFCDPVNQRPHRETGRPPSEMLAEEQVRLHVLPPSRTPPPWAIPAAPDSHRFPS